jgi:hypothetical protein
MEMLPEKGVCFSGKLTDNKKADREKGVNPADFALTGNYRQDCLSSKICLIAISLASASVKPPSIVQIAIRSS